MVRLEFELIRQEDSRASLGESPVWDQETGDIWWVDVTGKKLFRLDPVSRHIDLWSTPDVTGFVVLTAPGRPALGMRTGIYLFNSDDGAFDLLVPFERTGHRFNDATVDRLGRLWTSTMTLDAQSGAAAVQLVTKDLTLEQVVRDLTIPNGLAVDLELGRLFYSDSHPDIQSIWFQDLTAGAEQTGKNKPYATTKDLSGRPDGAAFDTHGFYWIAGVDGGELYVFDPEGQLVETIPVPFPAPTKIAFFGTQGRCLAVTSKGIGDDGGYMALAELPETLASGMVQPYWSAGV